MITVKGEARFCTHSKLRGKKTEEGTDWTPVLSSPTGLVVSDSDSAGRGVFGRRSRLDHTMNATEDSQ